MPYVSSTPITDAIMTLDPTVPEMMNIDVSADGDTELAYDSMVDGAIAQQIVVTTEILEGRKRRISAQITIPYPLEQVWPILTDYDHLADFIPSLKESRRIDHPDDGIRIEQIGSQSLLKFKFCARVVLDMFEAFPERIDFKMVEGDFKEFCGAWILQPTAIGKQLATSLEYTLDVLPNRLMPISLIEKKLSHNLKANLASIYQQANVICN